MPESGDQVILVTEGIALTKTVEDVGDTGLLFTEDMGRSESGTFDVDDQVVMVTDRLAAGSGTVTPSGDFDVSITGTNTPVSEGDSLVVTVDVTNNDSLEQTGVITLSTDGTTRSDQEITLSGGETTTLYLSWETEEGDAGDYTATVESGTDKDTASVTIEALDKVPSGDFDVEITYSNSPVGETATVILQLDVTNNDSSQQQGNIVFTTDGVYRDNIAVDIPGGEKHAVTVDWETQDGDAGDYTGKVESGTDSDTTAITVEVVASPESKTYTIKPEDTTSGSDRKDRTTDSSTVVTISDIRFIEATLQFSQEGTYWRNNAGMSLDPDDSVAGWTQDPIAILVGPGNSYGSSGTFDLGSTYSGDLILTVDDGDGTISPP